jgi:predicted dehydrogenase
VTKLRVGILGSGGIAARHAAAVATLGTKMQLVACCGRNEHKVAELAAKFSAVPYTDFRRMLQETRLDLLIVALPPYAHSGQVEAAAAAGIHVLVEKPIALYMQRAQSMVTAAKQAGIVAACGFMYRFGDAVMRWDSEAAAGATGRAGLFVGQFHCNALHAHWWREQAKSGGQLVEQLIHIIDLARHHLGQPQSVYARGSNFFHRGVDHYNSDDVSAMVLGYDDGRVGVLNATNGAVPGKWEKSWQVTAERMTGQFTGWNSAVLTHTQGGAIKVERIDTQTDVFVAQLTDIADAISARRAPRVPLEDGAKTLRIALAAARSSAEKREIRL